MDMTGRHVLVTGAGSGIGRSVATLLDRLGATLSLVDLSPSGLEESLSLLGSGRHRTLVSDLSNLQEADDLLRQAVDAGGRLHGMVHSAGIQEVLPAKSLTVESWRKVFAVNAEAGLALAKGFQSRKIYGGERGSIVFISSIMGLVGSPGAIAYSMSKAALHGMARSLALEYAPRSIRVNCVAPGFVKTALLERTSRLWGAEQAKAVESLHPLGFGEPEDVAHAVAFLLADTGRWITGSVLVVDGGYLAR